ncbi:uncharacterized protein (DUF1697 family) [Microbacterium endophyticum]|uniref:Uncharacterized protein (DUF1697 family) n=1 Tax=Microbacterium endophyticum TaxID=1526412 RepID=A0A7W4YPC0_9MICO|nr:DUF1697 domain-containing protein [Microbacterium endophyticum]MBB2977002.1 uncharacterized protein (DUF1697 family) [Microbacterium endophyticum]NIK36712.1 uncharacterized protein (DUF1697 family) [Microbacterium endophyticum]
MTLWVALLRGVNVGGVNVKSAELLEVFRGLGLTRLTAVLASGNMIFEEPTGTLTRQQLETRIEDALHTRFSYDAHVHTRTTAEIASALSEFPFDATDTSRQPYIVFCSDVDVVDSLLAGIGSPRSAAEAVSPGESVLYWWPVKGRSTDTPLAKVLTRTRYKPTTTTRNVRTVERILATMHKSAPST